MELNPNGTVKASSVREARRVFLKPKEGQTIRFRLATVCRSIRLGEIAVLDDREWLRVRPSSFHGSFWLEIN